MSCARTRERRDWLERLPAVASELAERWGLILGEPYDGPEVSAAWVVPVAQSAGTAVLKLGMPHMEARDEIEGLRFWDGAPTVRLLAADDELGAMLLERCVPGTVLRARPEREQDVVIAGLLRRLWRPVAEPNPFRPLAELTAYWAAEALARGATSADPGLVREGLRLYEELPRTAGSEVLLATDLHAGNVLRAEREPWLAIDPKPFVGDPAYDATQHLFNCEERLAVDPFGLIARFAELVEQEADRIRLWLFARAAVGSGEPEADDAAALARLLAT